MKFYFLNCWSGWKEFVLFGISFERLPQEVRILFCNFVIIIAKD